MKPDDRPVLLFAAPYFAPACHGGVVQIYLGLLARLRKFRVILVCDYVGTTPEVALAWDKAASQKYGFTVERLDAFEFHLPEQQTRAVSRIAATCSELIKFLVRGQLQWRALCRKYNPAVVLCGGTYSAGWLMPHNPRQARLVNYVHGEELTMCVRPRILQSVMRSFQRRSLRQADLNIVVSQYTADLILRVAGASPQKTTVFPNFIDHRRFFVSGKRDALREKYRWENKTVLLTVARLEKRKGIDHALRALGLLKQRNELCGDWLYIIGGRGPELPALKQLAQRLDLEEHVSFWGFIADADLPDLYQAADVFLQPNREVNGDTEGFGVVFLEANACGLPVIGGIAGGTADAIKHGHTGLRVDGDLIPEIADGIALLMRSGALRSKFREQGTAWAARFDVEERAVDFEKLLLQLVEQKIPAKTVGGQ